ncbi:MAG TPA: hypothetical protein VGR51_02055 [Thermoplasmata archaeon]|nr:hypothetical protein [Thermoplasmata archaeon]
MIASVAVFAVILAAASPPAANPWARLASGEPVAVQPRVLDMQPREIVPESVTTEYTVSMDDGFVIEGPLGSPGPNPTDAPFGAEVAVITDPDAQTHPSVAGEPSGSVLYAAYTDQTTPTNRDVYVARSTNGGASWTAVSVAAGAYNEFDPRVVVHGARVFVFFSNDDAATVRGYRYAVSTNQGTSWAVQLINFGGGGPFRDMRNPDASSASGQWLYVTYEMNCDIANLCGGTASEAFFTTLFDANGALIPNPHTIYFPFGIDIWEPSIVANQGGFTNVVADIDAGDPAIGGPPGSHDLVWLNSTTGQNSPASWGMAFITGFFSTDRVRVDSGGYGPNSVFVYQLINAAQGFNEHAILDLYTQDNGASYTLDLVGGQAGVQFKDPAVFASIPIMHVTFYAGGDLIYAYSLDAATTWSSAYKVNTNTGSVQDAMRSNDVTYAGKVRVCWQDNRVGNLEIFCSGFSGWSFYIFDRSPRYGTLDLDGPSGTTVPFAQLWPVGDMHSVVAPTPDQVSPGVRYVFTQWSDGTMTPTHAINVGAADTILTANYNTEYFLDISTTVGTVSPAPGWHLAGATVTIQWTPPAPGAGIRYTFNGWTGSGPGSYTGASNPVDVNMNGAVTEIADAIREFQVTLDTTPTGLQLTIDGTNFATPQQVWWVEGSNHPVIAITPQQGGTPLERFVFSRWADGTLTPSRTITATAAATFVAQYNLEYQVTVTTNPVGRDVTVDGNRQPGPQVLWWAANSVHLVDAPSPQTVGADTRYLYVSWSDAQPQSHSVTATAPSTLAATFSTEYRYVIDTSPTGLLIVVDGAPAVTAPQTYWWVGGTTHPVSLPSPQSSGPDSRRVFSQWSDGSTSNPRTVTSGTSPVPGAQTIQTFTEHRFRFDTSPLAISAQIQVNGVPVMTPGEAWLREGTTATIAAPSAVPSPTDPTGTQYLWLSWSNGGTQTQSVAVSAPQTLTANYRTQHFLTINTPYGNKVGEGWYDAGTTAIAGVNTDIVPGGTGIRYMFVQWSVDATGTAFSGSNPITMNGPKTATAVWKTQYQLTIVSTYGTTSQSNPSGWYDSGSAATVTVTPLTVSGAAETRYRFSGWTGGASGGAGTGTSNPITMDAPKTATAQWTTQFHVTIDLGGQSGIIASCAAPFTDCWVDQGSNGVAVLDQPGVETTPGQTRIGFIRWMGAATGTVYSGSSPFLVDQPKTVTVEWRTQHFLTLSGDNPSGTGSAVTQSGSPGNDGWYTEGTVAQLTVTSPTMNAAQDRRWVFLSWGGSASGSTSSVSVTMDGPKSVSLTFKEQVKVTIVAEPSSITITATTNCDSVTGGFFCDAGSPATLSVPAEIESGGKSYRFLGWSGGASGGASTTISPTGPMQLTARYQEKGALESPIVLGAIIAAIVAALLIAFLLLRRRKQEPDEPRGMGAAGAAVPPPPGAESPEAGTMACPSCGMTVPAVAGPCPICGTELAPPEASGKDERIVKLEEAYKNGRISKEQYQANLRRLRGNT